MPRLPSLTSRRLTGLALTGWVLATAAGGQQALPGAVAAGGEALSFSLGQRLEWRDGDTGARTALDFGYRSQTRTELFEVGLNTSLAWDFETDPVITPRLSLAYSREGARSEISVEASLRRRDLTIFDPLALLELEGPIEVEDLSLLFDEGQRIDRSLTLSYTFGKGEPVTTSVLLGLSDTSYEDFSETAAPEDRQNARLGLDVDFAVAANARLSVGLDLRAADSDAGPRRITRGIDVDYVIDRPRGALSFGASLTETPGGTRRGISISRALSFSQSALNARLGVSQGSGGDVSVTGALNYELETRLGALELAASRTFRTGQETELLTTRLEADYSRALTEALSLSLGASYLQVEDTEVGTTAETARLSLSVGYELTRNWQASLGATYNTRDSADGPGEDETVLFLGLNRSFAIRP